MQPFFTTQPFLAHILPAPKDSSIHLQAAVNLSSPFPLRLMAPTSKEGKASQATWFALMLDSSFSR